MFVKKIILIPLVSVLSFYSFADYLVKYPLVDVAIKDFGQWIASEPIYTSWINKGSPYDCTSASPLENTMPVGISYTKTFSGCHQLQERSVTTSEKHSVTGAIRNQTTNTESNVLTDASYTASSIGTKVVKECISSNVGGNAYRWYDTATYDGYTTTYGYGLEWAGVMLNFTVNTTKTYPKLASFVKDGYVYTRGVLKDKSIYSPAQNIYYYYYEACREPVTP